MTRSDQLSPTSSLSHFCLALPLTVGLAILLLAAACDSNTPACSPAQGTVAGQSVPTVNDAGDLTGFQVEKAVVEGTLSGTSSATFTIERVDEEGTMHLTGSHTFWDGENQFLFRTRDKGRTTNEGLVENEMTILEGATGTLSTSGVVNLKTGALTLDYTGEVCR